MELGRNEKKSQTSIRKYKIKPVERNRAERENKNQTSGREYKAESIEWNR